MNNNNNEMKSNVFSDYGNNNQNNISNQRNTPVNNDATVNGVPNQTVGTTSNNMGPVTNNGMNNPSKNIMNPGNPQTQGALNTPTMPNTNQPINQITNTQTTSSIMGTSNTKTTSSNANTYFQTVPDNKTNALNNQIPNQASTNQIPVNQDFALPKLSTTETVGTMKKDTQKSPVAMLALFACLIIGIFVIPYITPYLSDVLKIFGIDDNSSIYGDGKDPSSNTNKDNNVNKDNTNKDNDSKETTYYDILDTTSITFNKLTISNLTKTEENGMLYLNYKITNNDTTSYNFKEHKIYFDLYNDAKTYIGRVLIDTDTLNSKEEITLKSILNNNEYTTATKLEVLERTTADYQSVTLKNNKLTCTGNNHSTIYTFTSNKLTGIDDTYNYTFTVNDEAYAEYALSVQYLVNDLNKITGVSAGFVNTQTGFTKTMKINYSETSENLTKYDRIYYEKDIAASTVKYELESIGYKCD